MIIDHIGIVVPTLDEGIRQWTELFGYHQMTAPIENTRQCVRVVFVGKSDSLTIKLLEPLDHRSPITQYAQRGGGLHHICFRCESVSQELARLQDLGLRVLACPQPGEAFENEKIAFVYASNGLNVELIDTQKKAGRITS